MSLLLLFAVFPAFSECCDGDCLNDSGSFINQYGDIYTGNFKNGNYSGYGKMSYANGNNYEGNWASGYQQGWGIFQRFKGNKYEGEWNQGKGQGDATLYYGDGKKHIGQFRNSKPNGRGVYYNENGTIIADGYFEDGLFIKDNQQKNIGSAYLETFKVNRMVQKLHIAEFPFVSDFTEAFEQIQNAKAGNYASISSEAIAGNKKREGKVKIPGSNVCYVVADTYLANYGEFNSLEEVTKKFVEVYTQLMAFDKSYTVLNDMSFLDPHCVKRYLFFKDQGNYYTQNWLYLSIYDWDSNHKYLLELGCGFGAGEIMKAIPGKETQDKYFAQNLLLLLNDADNSFRSFSDDGATFTCMADMDPINCYNLNIELPGLGKLRYVPLSSSVNYKGVSGYVETPTLKEAEKKYHYFVNQVKSALGETYVYTESGSADKSTLEIVFASLHETHNDRSPVIRINLTETTYGMYQVLLTVQYDSFDILSRKSSLRWE